MDGDVDDVWTESDDSKKLTLRLFGPFEARLEGARLPALRSRKGQWLLALLALRAHRDVDRDWLAATLWADSPEAQTLGNLRRTLTDLRAALGPEAARLHAPAPHLLRLDLSGATVDVVAFDAAIARGDVLSLERAVSLYRGPLLEGCVEEWAFSERQAREQAYLEALETLAADAMAHGAPATAERPLRRAVATDPLRESAQRALMQVLAAGGQDAAALLVYRELRLLLHREMDAEPDTETTTLFEQIQAQARRRDGEVEQRRLSISPIRQSADPPSHSEATPVPESASLEPVGGAVPLDSAFYVVRPVDDDFRAAIARRDSIVLVKGARQMGKTSLLARGLHQARKAGARIVRTDFQALNATHLQSIDALFLRLAYAIADQLDLEVEPTESWHPHRGPSENLKRYWQRVALRATEAPVVWGLDEVDRLFTCDFGSEVFGLFRSWHNERALDPEGPWRRLTLAIAYATEHHLFITDVNQSPFNVGTRLTLEDLTRGQVADLNERYGAPLRGEAELGRYIHLVGGHPYLVRRGLHHMVVSGTDLQEIEAKADRDEGIFGDHLRRMLVLLARDPDLCDVVRGTLQGRSCPTEESFYRLRSAGLITGESAEEARPRCQLYATYLGRHLR